MPLEKITGRQLKKIGEFLELHYKDPMTPLPKVRAGSGAHLSQRRQVHASELSH